MAFPTFKVWITKGQIALLTRKMKIMPHKVQKKYMRRGVTKAARIVAKEAKANVREESGTLKRAIGQRVYTKLGDVVGLAGPRRNMGRITGRQTTGRKHKGRQRAGKAVIGKAKSVRIRVPTRYAHLLEFHTPGAAFMRPAWDRTRLQALRILRDEMRLAVAEFNRGKV